MMVMRMMGWLAVGGGHGVRGRKRRWSEMLMEIEGLSIVHGLWRWEGEAVGGAQHVSSGVVTVVDGAACGGGGEHDVICGEGEQHGGNSSEACGGARGRRRGWEMVDAVVDRGRRKD